MTDKKVSSEKGEELQGLGMPFDVEALYGMNQKFYKMMLSCNEELMTFGRNRLKEDLDMPQKLAGCKTPQEMANVCIDFYQTAFKQYTDEATQISKICAEVTAEAPEISKLPGD